MGRIYSSNSVDDNELVAAKEQAGVVPSRGLQSYDSRRR